MALHAQNVQTLLASTTSLLLFTVPEIKLLSQCGVFREEGMETPEKVSTVC